MATLVAGAAALLWSWRERSRHAAEAAGLAARLAEVEAERDDFARRLDRRINEIFSLQELSYVLSESLQTERIVEQVARFTARFLEADGTLVVLASAERASLRVAAAEGTLAALIGREIPSHEGGILTQAIGRERIELADGAPPGVELLAGVRVARTAVAPLRAHGMTLGAMAVAARSDRPFSTQDLWLISTVAMQAAVVLTNSRFFGLLRQGKEEWETTFDALSEGIALVDAEGRITRANRALALLAGVPLASLIGRAFIPSLFTESAAAEELIAGARLGQSRVPTLLPSDRLNRTLRLAGAPLPAQDGAASVVVMVEDVTDQRALEAQLIQNEKMAAVGQLVSGVAHELNNPLTSIAGLSELLLEQQRLPADARDHLQVIHEQADRAGRIVANLLTFARKGTPEQAAVDLDDVAQRTTLLIQAELKLRGITLTRTVGERAVVRGDRYEIQQVLLNLLTNAVHALSELPPGEERGVQVETGREGDRAYVRVRDTGPGIPAALTGRIFTPFFTTKQPGQGTGLGLSISYGIIESHGGKLAYAPAEGRGSIFTIHLPAHDTPAPPGEAPRRLLVADGDLSVLRVLTALLAQEGVELHSARTGAEAMTMAAGTAYDLVILDPSLSTANGAILPTLLHRQPGLATRVILLGNDRAGTEARDSDLPRLAKPLVPRDARAVILARMPR
ncbi:MAG TPA: ATP-binding protein [Gemmatimonadales bacterium]|nr:ATP-binding protein [Gemmatimonadales bacterium]